MAVKINKEMLLKNRFWIMLGVTFFLGLFGIIYLEFVNADEHRKKVTDEINKAIAIKNDAVKGRPAIDTRGKEAEVAKGAESKVWSEAYFAQQDVFKWAKAVEDEFDFYGGKFAIQVTVLKAPVKGPWPDDNDRVLHGVLADIRNSYMEIKARVKEKGKEKEVLVRIYRTENVQITSEGEPNTILWETGLPKHKDKVVAVTFQTGKYFNDLLRGEEQAKFAESYREQIHEILRSVEPLDQKGAGIVQLRDWLYTPDAMPPPTKKFIRYVTKEWNITGKMSDEAWIAQENIWIQKEIYRIIKSVNDDVKVFKRVEGKKGDEEKRNLVQKFRNSNFELQLTLKADNKLSLVIKNLLPRRQKQDLTFRVSLNKGAGLDPELIKISGKILMPAGTAKGEDSYEHLIEDAKVGKNAPRVGIYRVEQVLSWEAAAIKRIDHVSVGSNAADDIAHSHRTFPEGLRALTLADPVKETKSGGPGPGGAPGGGPSGIGGEKGKGDGKAGNEIGNRKMLAHDLWSNRYVEVSDQSRRVPVAVVLVVDQEYYDRVLTAFNNSKLRFLATQVLINQHTGSLQPPSPDKKDDGGEKKGAPGKGVGNPMGFGGGGAKEATGGGGSDLDTNMEMVIYGIMTLYQRYPPRPAEAKK